MPIDSRFYIKQFQPTEQQIMDLREIFEQDDVRHFCGISNSLAFVCWGEGDGDALFVICEKKTNKVCGIVFHQKHNKTTGCINVLAIHKDYRHLGLATQLLQHVEQLYKKQKVTLLQLTVFSHNQNAQALYYKYGFVPA